MSLPAVLAALPFLDQTTQAAGADSTGAAITALGRALERWHDFYLLSGTAAVTLVGLLFVALSFHLDAILGDDRTHHLAAARMAFLNFVFVLVLSLFFLMPHVPGRVLGAGALMLSLFSFGYIFWTMIAVRRRGVLSKHDRFLFRRFTIGAVVFALSVVVSLRMMLAPAGSALIPFMFVTVVTLVNATGIAWDLLVQVGRRRRAAGDGPKG